MEVQDYLKLITSENIKPKFESATKSLLKPVLDTMSLINQIPSLFSLDQAVGNQLDILGEYLHISRNLPKEIDGVPNTLDDETFRTVLKFRVMQYRWDGTINGLYNIITTLYPNTIIWLRDGNMEYQVVIMSPKFDQYIPELFLAGYILPKPAGIKVTYTIIESAIFAWDSNTEYLKGWDSGMWI